MSDFDKTNGFVPFDDEKPAKAEPIVNDDQPAKAEPTSPNIFRPTQAYTYQRPYANSSEDRQSPYSAANQPPYSYIGANKPAYQAAQSYNADVVKDSKPKQRSGFSLVTLIACLAACAVLSSVISIGAFNLLSTKSGESTTNNANDNDTFGTTDITINDESANFVEAVVQKSSASVVGVIAKYTYTTNNFFGSSSDDVESEGSGVIYSSDGYIITNKHVVDYAIKYNGTVEVYLPNDLSKPVPAKVVGYDAAYDLAVLKIDKSGLTVADIGSSNKLAVGERVVAIGNPGGLDFIGSVSVGYISGLDRQIIIDAFTMSLIQTDAAINPGNSGGALFNSEGKLIGITNSKIVSEEFEGMGFAIPIDSAVEICNNIITNQNEPTPYIGVKINTSYTPDILEEYGYPAGVVVESVVEGGPADAAGIEKYDVITAADGVKVTSYDVLVNIIQKHSVGEKIKLTIYRKNKEFTVNVTCTASNG